MEIIIKRFGFSMKSICGLHLIQGVKYTFIFLLNHIINSIIHGNMLD